MKNLFYLIVVICLPLIAFFQFQNWRKFHPPKNYTESPSPDIDPNYHNSDVVLQYFQSLEQAATYARFCWKEHRIDVKSTSPHSSTEQTYVDTYQQYLAKAQMLKQKLIKSAEWKKRGFGNEEIILLEEKGNFLPRELSYLLDNKVMAKVGDQSQLVFEVQKVLVEKGYSMPIDGVFKRETQEALKKFQTDQGIYPSGVLDRLSLEKLFVKTEIPTLPDSLGRTDSIN